MPKLSKKIFYVPGREVLKKNLPAAQVVTTAHCSHMLNRGRSAGHQWDL